MGPHAVCLGLASGRSYSDRIRITARPSRRYRYWIIYNNTVGRSFASSGGRDYFFRCLTFPLVQAGNLYARGLVMASAGAGSCRVPRVYFMVGPSTWPLGASLWSKAYSMWLPCGGPAVFGLVNGLGLRKFLATGSKRLAGSDCRAGRFGPRCCAQRRYDHVGLLEESA